MIFVTDERGAAIYASPDWTTVTGQTIAAAMGLGWMSQIHPADRTIIRGVLARAVGSQAPFTLCYRLRSRAGSHFWVVGSATPSFSLTGQRFAGFLGSVAALTDNGSNDIHAYGTIGRPAFPTVHPEAPPSTTLDLVTDHLLTVHALLQPGGHETLRQLVEMGLYLIGQEAPPKASMLPPAA